MRLAEESYQLSASFRSAEGIAVGTDVRLAGIKVGSVTGLELDPESYQAQATFTVREDVMLPEDSDVKIASEGLLGGSFLEITPGASDFMLAAGDEIVNTQGSVSLLNLLMRFGTSK
jgi:phospholipid/cholesterol/gamma-HCH transport system substrate-binding protein